MPKTTALRSAWPCLLLIAFMFIAGAKPALAEPISILNVPYSTSAPPIANPKIFALPGYGNVKMTIEPLPYYVLPTVHAARYEGYAVAETAAAAPPPVSVPPPSIRPGTSRMQVSVQVDFALEPK